MSHNSSSETSVTGTGKFSFVLFWSVAAGLPLLSFLLLPQMGDAGMNLWLPVVTAAWALFSLASLLFPSRFAQLGRASLYGFAGTGALYLLLTAFPVGEWISRPLLLAPADGNADAIMVLAAGIGEDAQPGFATYQRTLHGLNLYRQKRAPRLIFSTSNQIDARSGHHESEWALRLTALFGLATDSYFIMTEGGTTRGEAAGAARLYQPFGIRRLLLVTNGPHIRRATRVFEKAGFEILPAPVQTENSIRTYAETGVSRFTQALHEWIGLFVYRIRGDIAAF
ncbi:MAG TPA: YdcF family protein [Candidatus Ozemobacteraceae bacterium]|nr:YdcF family protein [Candidatus Ozemobacteraceae bacterium]